MLRRQIYLGPPGTPFHGFWPCNDPNSMHVELIFYELQCQHCPPFHPPPFVDPKTVGISGHLIAGKVSTWGPPFATPLNTPIEHCNRAAKATKYLLSFSSSWPGLVCLNLAWLGWPVLTWPEQVAAGLKCTWALRLTRDGEVAREGITTIN